MKIVISGTSGLVGSALASFLDAEDYQIYKLVRGRADLHPQEIAWDPHKGVVDLELLEGADAIVHLAGESIMGRWTARKKRDIESSRVDSTSSLVKDLARLKRPPTLFICASAIGFYGDRGEEWLTEKSPPGHGFLADVCEKWEAAAKGAADAGIRTINLRLGMVLSEAGGALKQMLTPFRWGLGGRLGSGSQYMSWITLYDLLHVIEFLVQTPEIAGPVNAVTPFPVQNYEFTKNLADELQRPAILPMPAFAVKWIFGQMGEELLLSSTRVKPQKLEEAQFAFTYPRLEDALIHCLARVR
jgi:uncharacterized protein (TIGR01777 family)